MSFSKAFSQGIFYYICNECYDSVEGGVSVLLPQKLNPGVFIQYNTSVPVVDDLFEIKSSLSYSHFFSKFQNDSYFDNKSYSLNRLAVMVNFDFLIKKKFILSPGADLSTYFSAADEFDFRAAASLTGGYKISDKLIINLKYIKAFEPLYFYGNKQDIDIINLGLNYRFK